MAFKKNTTAKKNTNTPAPVATAENLATFKMTGTISDVYDGKKYNYVTFNVDSENVNPRTNKPYYNTFRIQCDKSIALPFDEASATITGTISSFFDRDKHRTEYTFNADAVDVSDEPF